MNVDTLDLQALVAQHGAPLLLLSRREVVENYRRLQAQLPRARLYYAVKSNPSPCLLAALHGIGSGFDVASSGELGALLELGVPVERIIHTNPVKGFGEVERAAAQGVGTFFYDNLAELDKIARAAPGAGVVLRLAVVNPNCIVDLGEKFGCLPDEAGDLLHAALERGLGPRGLAFHVGSQTSIPQPYVDMIVICRDIFERMAQAGHPLRLLDIGGGFPVSYKVHMMSLESFCRPIREALEVWFPGTDILVEPGRVVSASAATLVARVIGKAKRHGMTWYYIDDGVYGSFSGSVFDHARYEVTSLRGGDPEPCVLSGPTCDSFDVISKEELLPPMEVGDLVVAHNMGAYTNASACAFNGIPVARVLPVD